MYEDAITVVRVNGHDSKACGLRVGVHQESVLSPLCFVIELEALLREFREGLPMELLYALLFSFDDRLGRATGGDDSQMERVKRRRNSE